LKEAIIAARLRNEADKEADIITSLKQVDESKISDIIRNGVRMWLLANKKYKRSVLNEKENS